MQYTDALIAIGTSEYFSVAPSPGAAFSEIHNIGGLQYGETVAASEQANAVAIGGINFGVGLTIIDPETLQIIKNEYATCFSLRFSPDGSMLAVGMSNGAHIYETTTWTETNVLSTPAEVSDISWSPDGAMIALSVEAANNNLHVFETATWTAVAGLPSTDNEGKTCDFSPDGSILAFGDSLSQYGSSVRLINTSDWSLIPAPDETRAYCVRFSPDGTKLAISRSAQSSVVYETAGWTKIAGLPAMESSGSDISWSNDGRYLAFGKSGGDYVMVLDWETMQLLDMAGDLPTRITNAVTFFRRPFFARKLSAKNHDQTPATASLAAYTRGGGQFLQQTITGEHTLSMLNAVDAWVALQNPDSAGADALAGATIDANSIELPPIDLVLGYSGDLATITSNLTTQAGAPGDEVVIRDWATRELVAKVTPEASGDWTAQVPPGTYDVSYIAENCAPVIHGPYTVTLP